MSWKLDRGVNLKNARTVLRVPEESVRLEAAEVDFFIAGGRKLPVFVRRCRWRMGFFSVSCSAGTLMGERWRLLTAADSVWVDVVLMCCARFHALPILTGFSEVVEEEALSAVPFQGSSFDTGLKSSWSTYIYMTNYNCGNFCCWSKCSQCKTSGSLWRVQCECRLKFAKF